MNEQLSNNEFIIRICPQTKKPVLCIHEGNGRILDLHNNNIKDDIKEVKKLQVFFFSFLPKNAFGYPHSDIST